ncbi:acetyl-CoA carboxylase biotin carboxyl carrier protein [Flammeovirgaceae bacterium SG7u.111]|nr:acetyl-CoA carboxylase biotin carboxyl carrier protein [Flammeovirgaceae bacterium SG7u.132]WPO38434.1 acetyl-CoA carboxylase biotin carboxyl carrier protein [Flammeovirgaceae bacterium SG7u.111]
MKAKEIKELIDFISSSGLAEVNIETDEIKLHIIKQHKSDGVQVVEQVVAQQPVATPQPVAQPAAAPIESAAPSAPPAESNNYITIKSPMIGTFYNSPNPDSDAFVSVGDQVSAGKVVCIIEAMKLFNEIESEISGKVVKVLVDNATPVEYDQPLFLVDPS